MNNHDELKMTKSSGNVFKDLGYPNADEHLLKAKFAIVINNIRPIQYRSATVEPKN